jgi:hypothetical protein
MRIKAKHLRKLISEMILENAGLHRCLNGNIVSDDSQECLSDVGARIEDATYHRDLCPVGTDERLHLNGLLKGLRKKRRRISKVVPMQAESELSV